MWKWFKWVLLSFLIIIVGLGIYFYCRYIVWMTMKPAQIKKAEAALAKGIKVDDLKNDFVTMGSNKEEVSTDTNNENPYRVGFLDIKSTEIGADEDFIYTKVTFWDTIPKKHPAVDILQGINKMAGVITWEIGSNQYKIDNSEKYQSKFKK